MTVREICGKMVEALRPVYDEREAAAMARWYVQDRLRWQPYELALRGATDYPADGLALLDRDLPLLREGCPLQYVLGHAPFYGHEFEVTRNTLIPRPETEELVQRVVEEFSQHPNPRLWDMGTGSGCIAVSLAKALPRATVFATDISPEALEVARRNAAALDASVTFAQHDMLNAAQLPFGNARFDAIVSNPPYIPQSQRDAMHTNVRDYEPQRALFVPDDNPLLFYEAIATLGAQALAQGGCIHVETYEDFHDEMRAMFSRYGFAESVCFCDINEKPRAMRCAR